MMFTKRRVLYNLVLSAIFLALAFVLPFLTGQIPEIGSMLCPMHIPVILCGFICGWQYGLVVGICAPLLRSIILGMPPLFPAAFCMAFELGTYALVSALMYKFLPKKKGFIYIDLLIAMIAGRIVWGLAMFACVGLNSSAFGVSAFLTGAFVNAVPGIILQIILIPILVMIYYKIQNSSNKEVTNGKKRKEK